MRHQPGARATRARLIGAAIAGLTSMAALADSQYSAPVGKNYPLNLYWGDTHLHSRNSADAYSLGNMNLTPADAYRFARGQELTAHNGMRVRLRRPLDFLVVSDHAEYLGGYYRFGVGDPLVANTDAGRQWAAFIAQGNPEQMIATFTGSMDDPQTYPPFPSETRRLIWQDVAQTADDYNDPGRFTAFTGYEWTSMIDGNNLHRVVIYKDGADKAGRLPPFSGQDSLDPRDLWRALARYEAETGGEVIAIPHNGNLSNGMMFPAKSVDGRPLDRAYAQLRSRWEPIAEVTQVKGDSEAHPTLSPDDEFADFETWDWDNIGRNQAKEDWMLPHEYARGALKLGLGFEADLGVNPFKFGMIGSTDNHTSLATAAEDNYFGKFAESEPGLERLENAMAAGQLWENWKIVASGYAAVWARENTREELFAAMKRREVYATTGTRIAVRFFGGWDYDPGVIHQPAYLDIAYANGVPMGGDLTAAPQGAAPTFIAVAAKDPDWANLDRIQIVKGWLDSEGNLHEKVHDVALSDGREVNPESGKAPPVGTTVNVAEASYTNTIGAPMLAAVWTDPDFDPAERAFYYARVIEIPTPRWTAYDARYFNIDLPDHIPTTVQDRAYTSPIWYTP
ncbi:MAG: DUF3604 domain-containing protein [Gammaproteobacteria bacterium]|nr:DUF3604 domain-containing protein [Gammaproteobacteria bacterium]